MVAEPKNLIRPKTFRTFQIPHVDQLQPEVFLLRRDYPQEILAAEADTQGWDAASAVRLSQVNTALRNKGVYPDSFSHEVTQGWHINGKFGQWTMTRGGSGSIVFLKIPITSASMTAFGKEIQFQDGSVTIQVKLNYLPQLPDTPDDKGIPNNLLTDSQARSADDPAVVIQTIKYGSNPPPFDMQALFQSAIGFWFNSHIGLFSYIFAVVSLNQVAQTPQFQWLKPTYTGYAYYDGNRDTPGEDEAYFGALTMTGGRAPTGLANQLPAGAIPNDEGAALLIGMNLFLENMALPAIQGAFPGSSPSDFTLSDNNTSIQLKRNLDMEKVRVGAIDYQPTAEQVILQIVGDEIQTRMKIHIPISPGIDAYVNIETWYRLQLVNKTDGSGQTIDWVESRPAKKENYYTKATWVTVTEIIVSIIGLVAAAVAGVLLQGVVRVVVIIIIGIVAGIAAATPEIIARAISDGAAKALPPLERMLTEFTKPIEWPDTTGFILSAVQLNGSLQLSGSFATS